MIELEPPLRLATAEDALRLAELLNLAGEGLPLHLWNGMAAPGQDPWDVGRARQAEKVREGKIIVVDTGQGAIAGLTGYVIGPDPTPIGADFPRILRPLQELENAAPNSWYVNVLAVLEEHRGRGHGAQLLEVADALGSEQGLDLMSLIVASNNTGARRLYERHGYRETAERPCIKEDWVTDIESWLLMTKQM